MKQRHTSDSTNGGGGGGDKGYIMPSALITTTVPTGQVFSWTPTNAFGP